MTGVIYPFAVLTALGGALAWIGISSRQPLWLKTGAIALTAMMVVVSYAAFVDLLSRPKPLRLEWSLPDLSEATVLGARFREGETIYLWVQVDGLDEPRYYALPWQEALAKQLHGAQQEAQAAGTEVRMKRPSGQKTEKGETVFYPAPQPALPPKQAPGTNVRVFQRAGPQG